VLFTFAMANAVPMSMVIPVPMGMYANTGIVVSVMVTFDGAPSV